MQKEDPTSRHNRIIEEAMAHRRASAQTHGHGQHPRIEPPPSPAPASMPEASSHFLFIALACGAIGGALLQVSFQHGSFMSESGKLSDNKAEWDPGMTRRPSPTRKQLSSQWDDADNSLVHGREDLASAWSRSESPSRQGYQDDGLSRRLSV
jgi:hypothetical protein